MCEGRQCAQERSPLSKILALFAVGAYKHSTELAREPSAKGHPPATFLRPRTPPPAAPKLTQIKLNAAVLQMG